MRSSSSWSRSGSPPPKSCVACSTLATADPVGVNQRASIVLTDDEVAEFLAGARSATMATVGPDGQPHLVAMWFALVDGDICFETKGKSQKAVNLRRDPRISVLVEDGATYEDLRGVSIEGTAEVTDDADL